MSLTQSQEIVAPRAAQLSTPTFGKDVSHLASRTHCSVLLAGAGGTEADYGYYAVRLRAFTGRYEKTLMVGDSMGALFYSVCCPCRNVGPAAVRTHQS